ncbi:hypothetical protein WH47_02494 [Habropoda laboriosa]|uniref:Uncharacterized protein n=1 Tax=Habropoda laboriosa TaxID=597456 RepID=A0A0L7QYD1_9HYME|nr:hypothetical protein WH47_02494 [Habropoda laboriosa]
MECPFCGLEETSDHVVFDCPKYDLERRDLQEHLGDLSKYKNDRCLTIEKIKGYKHLAEYAKKVFAKRKKGMTESRTGPPPRG